MDGPTWWCPHGHGELVHSDTNGVHATCDVCHGFAVTIWLLGEMLVEGAGSAIWRAGAGAPAGPDKCPACGQPVPQVAAQPGAAGAATLDVCRNCELVWVEPAAVALLPVLPELAAAAGVASPDPTHCTNCGALAEGDDDGRCRYCRAELPHVAFDVVAPLLAQRAAAADLEARRTTGEFVEDYIQSEATRTEPLL
jgi:hypothetical protein